LGQTDKQNKVFIKGKVKVLQKCILEDSVINARGLQQHWFTNSSKNNNNVNFHFSG